MDASQIDDLAGAFALLGILSGMVGAVLFLLSWSVMRWLLNRVRDSDWWLDRTDRAHARSLNASQRGRAAFGLLFWLSAVLVALLAACSPPTPSSLTGSDQWWDSVRSRGWDD